MAPPRTDLARRFGDVIPFVAGAGVLAALFLAAFWAIRMFDDRSQEQRNGVRRKEYRRTLAEDVRISRHGVYGVDFVRCGSCRMEKRKKGILTLGGFNVLLMDDLSIVLPPREDGDDGVAEAAGDSPRDVARRLGISDGFLSGRGMSMKFSGLRINGLKVSRLAEGGRVEPVFAARTAEAVRGGLALNGCSMACEDGRMEQVGKAMLVRSKGGLRLVWNGGERGL